MPFKSRAQQRFMFAAEARGELKKGTAKHWADVTPNIKALPERVKKASAFLGGFDKTAALNRSKIYKGLEYGGLGALAATDAYDAYKAHKKGDKSERNKALLNTGALGALMGATHLAPH
jgi:hypothetical protein